MPPYRRNILVGLSVLGSVLIFGWMVLKFSSKTAQLFAPPQIPVHFQATRADGLAEGSEITYLGVGVGRIMSLSRDANGIGVTIDALLDRDPPLPKNLRAQITQTSAIGGGSIISLDVDGDQAIGTLSPNQTVKAQYVGLNLFPPALSQMAAQIGVMSDEIRKTVKQLRESGAIDDLDKTIKTIDTEATKAGSVLDSVQSVLGDPKVSQDVKAAVAHIRSTTEKLDNLADNLQTTTTNASAAIKDTQGHVDQMSQQVGDRLTQVAAVLGSLQDVMQKIDKGQGTAGQFVNDPRLYQSLVDSTRELDATVTDLKRLVEQWEEEGVSLKLK
jgi:phospholipid/cholesterol/gamma-HCH transport system substrate-binding protein